MPRRKQFYRKKKKKTYKRKNYKLSPFRNMGPQTGPSGVPRQRIVKLRYSEAAGLSTTSGVLQTVIMGANDPYDPYTSSGGHQPMGWDTMATMYNEYVVIGSKITCRVMNNSVTNATYCGVYLGANSSADYLYASGMIENRMGTSLLISPNQDKSRVLTCNYSAKKFYNVTNISDNKDRLGASVGSSPTEGAFFIIWAQSHDRSTTATFYLDILVEYIVLFSEPKALDQS